MQELEKPDASVRKRLRLAKRERGLSNVSINKTLTLLRQVLHAGVRDECTDRNPVDFIRCLKTPKKAKPFLQLDQIDALVEATAARYPPLVLTFLLAGLRIGEALALRWDDVDLLSDPPRIDVTRNWDPASVDQATRQRGIEGRVKTGEEGPSRSAVACSRPCWTSRHAPR
jgi:integrase